MENTAATRRGIAIGLVLALLAVLLWTANEDAASAASPAAELSARPIMLQIGDNPDLAPFGSAGSLFVKYDGVDGEAQDSDHEGWIDGLSFDWGVNRPDTATTTRVRAAAEVNDFELELPYDKAAPKLLEAAFIGKVFPKLEVELTRTTEEGRQVYLKYELKNVMITSYSVNGSGNDEAGPPTVVVSNNFEEIKVTYTEYDEQGNPKGNVETQLKTKG